MMPKLLRTNIAYAIGGVSNSLALVLLIPYLVTALSTSDYGTWGLFEVIVLVITMVSLAGFDVGMMRLYWATSREGQRRQTVGTVLIGSAVWGISVLTILLGIVWFLNSRPAIADLFNFNFGWRALSLVVAIGVTEGWFALLLSVFRIRESAIEYVVSSFIRMALFLTLSIWGVQMGWGVEGALLGRFLASVIGIILVAFLLRRYINLEWQGATWRQVVQYGLPLLPTNFATYLLLASDRYFLNIFYSTELVGIYTFMYKVATTIDIIVIRPFALDWAPRRFKIANRPDAEQTYGRVLLLFLWATLSFALCVTAGTELIYTWVPRYSAAQSLVPLILLSFIIYGLSYPLNIGMMLKDRTSLIAPLAWIGAIVCVLLNLWWIPLYGMTGAAWATLVSYSVYTLLIAAVSQRLYPVKYSIGAITQIVLATIVSSMGMYAIDSWGNVSVEVATGLKGLWVMVIMLSVGYYLFNDQLWQGRAAIAPMEVKQ